MQENFYFSQFENRTAPLPTKYSAKLEFYWQIFAAATIALGIWYLVWRWTNSLNPNALVFSIIVAASETLAFVGLALFFNNLWKISDTPQHPPPENMSACTESNTKMPVTVDIFIATFDENPEIVRLSIKDAKAVVAPPNTTITIHLLDDGNRLPMRKISREEQVNYLGRRNNIGYKAGNLKNALDKSSSDFIVICDADTRLFSSFLQNTLGYFCDLDVAWVQTPQWFYDIPAGRSLAEILSQKFGSTGGTIANLITRIFGPIRLGKDPFSSDPGLFFDIIQRRRNGHNASFCCGAGSIHRREALMEVALMSFGRSVEGRLGTYLSRDPNSASDNSTANPVIDAATRKTELMPYLYHVSEDIFTSLYLHAYPHRTFKSVFHPKIESKMLSPLSLQSWAIQNFKYAGGTLDIFLRNALLVRAGMSWQQKLLYGVTFWSYLSPLWITVLLCAPIITMATGIAPVQSYSSDFYLHLVPFLLCHEVASVLGTWGHDPIRGKWLSITSFALTLSAFATVLKRKKIRFPATPKEEIGGWHPKIIRFHATLILATLLAFSFAAYKNFTAPDPEALAALIVNGFWGGNNILALWLLVSAALWNPDTHNYLTKFKETS